MGYASYLEDIVAKISDIDSMINKSNLNKTAKIQTLTKDKHSFFPKSKNKKNIDEFGKMQEIIKSLKKQNTFLNSQIVANEKLLDDLKKEISLILEKHANAIKIIHQQNNDLLDHTVNKVNDANEDVVLKLKSGILQIGSIINQQNFHKKAENINNIKLLIKKLTSH